MGNHDLKSRSFLSLLLTSLHEASSRPHDAFQAARCMRCLLVSKEVESLLVEMSVFDAISSAHNVGLTFHQDLERESNQLMGKLQCLLIGHTPFFKILCGFLKPKGI